MHRSKYRYPAFLASALSLAGGVWMITAQPTPTAGAFTAEQAVAGRVVYETNCAGCHLPSLAGRGDAPPLAGSQFMTGWGVRTTRDLVTFIQASMPPLNPGSLADADYINVSAFILQSNGAASGPQPLTAWRTRRFAASPQAQQQRLRTRRRRPHLVGEVGEDAVVDSPPRGDSPSPAKSKTTCRSPRKCSATPTPVTGS